MQPTTFRDFVGFEAHMDGMTDGDEEVLTAWARQPTYLYGSPHAAVGSGSPVADLWEDDALDFELEVGVVIGRSGRDLTPAEAGDHIAGYLVVNDWSARAVMAGELTRRLGPSKSKDFATTLGPWLVTPDELKSARVGDRLDLRMTARVNGEVVGEDTLANMSWSFEELISYASRSSWVRPGDVLASGTCADGCLAEAWHRSGQQVPPPLRPGDEVTLTVERLGRVTNPVAAAPLERAPVPPARRLGDLTPTDGVRR